MTENAIENLRQINELWGIHNFRLAESSEVESPCLAFILDKRYVLLDGMEMRLGVSFGENPFTPDMATGFLPPPVKPGKYLFGIHLVGVRGNRLGLFDEWCDSKDANGCDGQADGIKGAEAILAGIPDHKYRIYVSETGDGGDLAVSDVYLLEDFQIAQGEEI